MSRHARTEVPIHPLLSERWSPRSFDDAHHLPDRELTGILEAARWAPSANNSQPWRFVVARRGTATYDLLFDALLPGNQLWAGTASALVLVAAEVVDDSGAPRRFALYDAGQAAAHLSAQASAYGLVVHQMGGFDADTLSRSLALPASVSPVVVLAVGRHDPAGQLPEALALREQTPRTRRPLSELVITPALGTGRLSA